MIYWEFPEVADLFSRCRGFVIRDFLHSMSFEKVSINYEAVILSAFRSGEL
ncbi:hypothetical protein [Kaistella sp. SH19-2b]|uniref:hypothetical protein n=1 Tax=Kaistella sp. SH19-2b TaxID=2986944 RepID=UPI0027367096|nr:hypothetical protein [Kaistella sp. SH19-2b]MDP2459629.1 hypothetical protein [Kaistella sp. SH19-2b]